MTENSGILEGLITMRGTIGFICYLCSILCQVFRVELFLLCKLLF